jgi:RND superfamily putative drug exporter
MRIPGAESQEALDLLEERFPSRSGTSATLVFHAEGLLQDPQAMGGLKSAVDGAAALPHVLGVDSPVTKHGQTGISSDGTIAFATVHYDASAEEMGREAVDELDAAVQPARDQGLQVELSGAFVSQTGHAEPKSSEVIGLLAAVVVLLLAFGSVVAMGLPIGTALLGLVSGLGVVALGSHVVQTPTVAPTLATMIGLGVGIDYALFIVTRYRENLARGLTVEDAVGRAIATSGAAVVFAGGTVVIAILGLWIAGIPFVGMLGTAAAVSVLVAVVAAVTLLPALLGFAGRAINKLAPRPLERRAERALAAAAADEVRGWAKWARTVARHPWWSLSASTAVLVLLALPLFSMRLGQIDAGSKAEDRTERKAYDLLSEGFGPGFNGPLLLTVELGSSGEAALEPLSQALASDPGVARVMPAQVSPDGTTAVLTAIPATSPQDQATTDLVHRLRDQTIPGALEGTGAEAWVGGPTAANVDLADKVAERLPWFIGAVVLLSFLLLMLVFRSILVPLKAALLNVLSIGAAYGVVVAIFQWGWLKDLVGVESTVPIVSFVPMMMFAILFGLSMDYEVFLLSRIREEYLSDGDNLTSVVSGISDTARVITSAALIMISVFVAFVLNDDTTVKMVGIGLATAVAVDATVVRIVLVPSTMVLLGDANWWLPRWLHRLLPKMDIEGEQGLPPAILEMLGATAAEPEPVGV